MNWRKKKSLQLYFNNLKHANSLGDKVQYFLLSDLGTPEVEI